MRGPIDGLQLNDKLTPVLGYIRQKLGITFNYSNTTDGSTRGLLRIVGLNAVLRAIARGSCGR